MNLKQVLIFGLVIGFLVNSAGPLPCASAYELFLPPAGTLLSLSHSFAPASLKGIVVHPDNGLKFDFIIDRGQKTLNQAQKKAEYARLVKYFLSSLAVPDRDQWVNLSPFEKNRIIEDDFGRTQMGRDLLAQDYVLKQMSSSLIYPEDNLGRRFWSKVYARVKQKYGTTDVPVDTFNKVWVVPDMAELYEKGHAVFLLKSHLKVMLQEDYLAKLKRSGVSRSLKQKDSSPCFSPVIRELVLPILENEINKGAHFAVLRQAFSGMILAAWYKRALRKSLLGRVYANKHKLKGIDQDPRDNEAIYRQYLKAYRKGVFNYIKVEPLSWPASGNESGAVVSRKYFSGGVLAGDYAQYAHELNDRQGIPLVAALEPNVDIVGLNMLVQNDPAQKAVENQLISLLQRTLFLAIVSIFVSGYATSELSYTIPDTLFRFEPLKPKPNPAPITEMGEEEANVLDYGINRMNQAFKDETQSIDLTALHIYLVALAVSDMRLNTDDNENNVLRYIMVHLPQESVSQKKKAYKHEQIMWDMFINARNYNGLNAYPELERFEEEDKKISYELDNIVEAAKLALELYNLGAYPSLPKQFNKLMQDHKYSLPYDALLTLSQCMPASQRPSNYLLFHSSSDAMTGSKSKAMVGRALNNGISGLKLLNGALTGARPPGGIDFNAAMLSMKIKGQAERFPLSSKQNIGITDIAGLEPEIMYITPANLSPQWSKLLESLIFH